MRANILIDLVDHRSFWFHQVLGTYTRRLAIRRPKVQLQIFSDQHSVLSIACDTIDKILGCFTCLRRQLIVNAASGTEDVHGSSLILSLCSLPIGGERTGCATKHTQMRPVPSKANRAANRRARAIPAGKHVRPSNGRTEVVTHGAYTSSESRAMVRGVSTSIAQVSNS